MDNSEKSLDRVTIPEAARRLGIKEESVRKRLTRGALMSDKDEDGRVYVYLDMSKDATAAREGEGDTYEDKYRDEHRDELIEAYRDQIAFLREELQRKDAILMSLTQRIPELEAPERQESDEEPARASAEGARGSEHHGDQGEPQTGSERPWWRRVFGA